MNSLDVSILFGILILLIILSALFSSSETSMMALNRYRLKHKVKSGHKGAILAQRLLEKPDRLLGVILLGNNFVNIFASSIATIIAMKLIGEAGIALAAGLLTLVILVFAEVAPKTVAALYPEKIAYPAAYVLTPLLKLLSPLVWLVNFFANGFLRSLGIKVKHHDDDHALTHEELQTLINEATSQLPAHYRSMLSSVLQLESVTVEDVMIPKQDVYAIDVDQPIEEILKDLQKSPYTRVPIYRGSLDEDLIGILNLRRALPVLMRGDVTLKDLIKISRQAYFIPETTSLSVQLGKFNQKKRRMALIVDEYGDLQGLLTVEDLLEEIVGKLSTDAKAKPNTDTVEMNEDGSMAIDASEFIRDLNKDYELDLPTDGPKTINGLIQETMESIPPVGTCIKVDDYVFEVTKISQNAIETVKLSFYTNQRTRHSTHD
ncbi:HlyC/CorC family transporter [Thiomicrorhabdus sp. 6S3-12]|uniref:HlyC/CorC family transporter n=1 Tax=Thiomicrorhabdus sp. 6S3-12 TaxID=2819681 RepID=UPI001AAE0746|nr:HlyC/CorC family transporter [Thiomicrorhabdus sp. 6S3-12]MBO1922943.1 HlyC/CorC family transporter [Thiomicrorhabdus sp. 6S3-12]